MVGTILNVAGILAGGVCGLARRKPLPPASENYFKVALAAFTSFYGLRLTWLSLNGPFLQILKQFVIVILAMILGRLAGRLFGLQEFSNQLGRDARDRISAASPASATRTSDGFLTGATLFCAAPLALLGATQDGLSGYYYPLAVKAVLDGLAVMGLVALFGPGIMLSALPVLAFQGTVTLICARVIGPFLATHSLLDSANAVGGLLVVSVALVMLGIKRIPMADYLPALLFAPFFTWLFS